MPDNPNDPKTPCPKCNAMVPAGNKFCEVCGAIMPPQRTCPKCGKSAFATTKFCEQCGASLTPAAVVSQTTPVPPPAPVKPPLPPASKESAPVQEPESAGQKADAEKPSSYIPPSGTKAAATSSSAGLPLPAEKPVMADPLKPVTPVNPPVPGTGIAGNKKIIIGAVVGIVILVVIALVALPALNANTAAPGSSASAPAAATSTPSAFSPFVTTAQPAGSPTSAASSSSAGSGSSMVPGPTEVMPESTNVLITADKDVITGAITVQIAGGPGRSVIKEVQGTVYSSDGQKNTGIINPALHSEELVIPGSKGTDRVVVTVLLFSGEQYIVMDKIMTFRARG